MFKKAKQKIVFSILAILSAVLLGTLGMICLSSYMSATAQNYRVLEKHIEMATSNVKNGVIGKNDIRKNDEYGWLDFVGHGPKKIQRNLEIGTFYEVKLLADGSITVMENGAAGIYTDEELVNLAVKVCGRDKGHIGKLIYMVNSQHGETMVCFMDNTVVSEGFARLFLFTLLFGVIAMVAITFISIRIANRIVMPMEEMYQKQKQFTADAGHELKTPVAVVAANIELLQREIGENKWLDSIAYENNRMRELVTELLELSRSEQRQMECAVTDLSRIVNSTILPYEATAFEHHIMIETEIAEGVLANVNEKSIQQLVAILIDNAISHTKCMGDNTATIFVTLQQAKGTAILRVSNPGEEIPESEREKLFERFYRADGSHEFTGHYGLGLAIAKAISDANHSKISVSCQEHMVSFSVVFPAK